MQNIASAFIHFSLFQHLSPGNSFHFHGCRVYVVSPFAIYSLFEIVTNEFPSISFICLLSSIDFLFYASYVVSSFLWFYVACFQSVSIIPREIIFCPPLWTVAHHNLQALWYLVVVLQIVFIHVLETMRWLSMLAWYWSSWFILSQSEFDPFLFVKPQEGTVFFFFNETGKCVRII